MILVGYAAGVLINAALAAAFEAGADPLGAAASAPQPALGALAAGREALEAGVIGYIVPGLIAIWLDRQGVVPTMAALVTSAVVVRLVLILAVPEELQWFEAGPELFTDVEEVAAP
jgi:hypothetical protein